VNVYVNERLYPFPQNQHTRLSRDGDEDPGIIPCRRRLVVGTTTHFIMAARKNPP